MRSVELFTGAGGLALGLEAAGFTPVLMIERDDHCYRTIRANQRVGGPTEGWPVCHGDVRDVDFSRLRGVELVAGGPPCQPFSIGGKHRGPDDSRDMWPEAIRAVREIQPKAFLFENVRGLTRAAFADYLRYIIERLRRPEMVARSGEAWAEHLARLSKLSDLEGEGPRYQVESRVINAADFGAAQKRHRVIIVGVRADLGIEWRLPIPTHSRAALIWDKFATGSYWRRHGVSVTGLPEAQAADIRLANQLLFDRPTTRPWRTVRDAISDLPDPLMSKRCSVENHRFQPGARIYVGHTGSLLDEPAKALKAGDHGVPGGENMLARTDGTVRYFTIRESARLQGFPDAFIFPASWTESMRQLGNAVPVPVATTVASAIAEALDRSRVRAGSRQAA